MTKPKSTGGCGTFFILAILFAIAQLVEEKSQNYMYYINSHFINNFIVHNFQT